MFRQLFLILLFFSGAVIGQQSDKSTFYEDSALCSVFDVTSINTKKAQFAPTIYRGELIYVVEPSDKPPFRLFSPWKKERYYKLCSSVRRDSLSYAKSQDFNGYIQNKYTNGSVCFTPDDSTMYFTRSAPTNLMKKAGRKKQALKLQIFYTAMNMYGLAHPEIHPFAYNSFDYNCMHPAIDKSGKKLFFASDMPGTLGGTDIFVCEWQNGSWSTPKNLGPQINTTGNEIYPHITKDGVLWFASDGRPGLGGLDLFFAEPSGNDKMFREAENAGSPFNTSFNDFGIFLKDSKRGYFSSNRKSGERDDDIYYFVNNKPRAFPVKVAFTDSVTGGGIAATFTLNSDHHDYMEKLDSGKYFSTRLKQGKEMTLSASAKSFRDKEIKRKIEYSDSVITVVMAPKALKCIEGKIYDRELNLPIKGMNVAIYDEDGRKYLDVITDSTGTYMVCNLPLDKDLYIGSQKKPEYFTNTERFRIKKDTDLVRDFGALKIVVGKAIKVDNIYFDKGKFNVRPDAASELDKLAKLMKDNPEIIIELSSHSDCNGPAAANLKLSDKRAKSSAAYIVSKGISSSRVKGKGYGESKLLNDCKCEGKTVSNCTEEQHAINRRTEFKVTGFVTEKKKPEGSKKEKGKK